MRTNEAIRKEFYEKFNFLTDKQYRVLDKLLIKE